MALQPPNVNQALWPGTALDPSRIAHQTNHITFAPSPSTALALLLDRPLQCAGLRLTSSKRACDLDTAFANSGPG